MRLNYRISFAKKKNTHTPTHPPTILPPLQRGNTPCCLRYLTLGFKQWRSQPSLSGGAKWKNLPDFYLSFPIVPFFPDFSTFPDFFSVPDFFPLFPDFPRFFPDFPDFSPIFPIFGNFFAVKGALCPPPPPTGYATAFKR